MLKTLSNWFGKRNITIFSIVVLTLIILGIFIRNTTNDTEIEELNKPTVEVKRVSELSLSDSRVLIGTIESINEVLLESEAGGRVTRVSVELGDIVGAGTIIAELENASQRAAVLQAEGAYEAALANAESGNISVLEAQNVVTTAQNSASAAYRGAFTTFSTILRNDIDQLFSNPEGSVPGVKVKGLSYTNYLNSERVRFQSVLQNWQVSVKSANGQNIESLIPEAQTHISDLIEMTDIFLSLITDSSNSGSLSVSELAVLAQTLAANRSTLNSTLSTLESADTTLRSAKESLSQATLRGTTAILSSSNAQVKQALGSLRAAQASLSKTIIRTPIAGTVNVLNVRVGEFISSSVPVATIANNDSLIARTYVGESDRAILSIGQEVTIEGTIKGVISAISPGIDPTTKKFEVKVAAESTELVSGETVNIQVDGVLKPTSINNIILVPISAVKFTGTNGLVFTVDDGELTSHSIEIGSIIGNTIEITSGVTSDMEIVVDSRGLVEGQMVEAI